VVMSSVVSVYHKEGRFVSSAFGQDMKKTTQPSETTRKARPSKTHASADKLVGSTQCAVLILTRSDELRDERSSGTV